MTPKQKITRCELELGVKHGVLKHRVKTWCRLVTVGKTLDEVMGVLDSHHDRRSKNLQDVGCDFQTSSCTTFQS
nr:hypothetical protein [Chionoecetes opilio bacilliform virus]